MVRRIRYLYYIIIIVLQIVKISYDTKMVRNFVKMYY